MRFRQCWRAFRERGLRVTRGVIRAKAVPGSGPHGQAGRRSDARGWRVTSSSSCPRFRGQLVLPERVVGGGLRVTPGAKKPSPASSLGDGAAAHVPETGSTRPRGYAAAVPSPAGVWPCRSAGMSSGYAPPRVGVGTNRGTLCSDAVTWSLMFSSARESEAPAARWITSSRPRLTRARR